MTTGEFRSVPIDIIRVNQDERQRSKLDGVDRIAGSVRKRGGFINPPLITRDYRRICGEQRVEAAKQRGHAANCRGRTKGARSRSCTKPIASKQKRVGRNGVRMTQRYSLAWINPKSASI